MSDSFIGEIKMFGGNFAPRGFAFCSGQIMSISQNTALFSLLGTQYGGNGQTTFALPDLRGRVPVHKGQGLGLSNRSIGEQFGTETVTLTAAELPLHSHSQMASTNAATLGVGPSAAPGAPVQAAAIYGAGAPQVAMAADAIGAAGGNQPHNNMAPYCVVNFIIALQGIFPSRN